MRMNLGFDVTMTLGMKIGLAITGGLTGYETIFPEIEDWLADPDRRDAVLCIANPKRMRRYRSVVDFLVCETLLVWRGACFRYYAGDAPLLKDITTPAQRAYINRVLLHALELAAKAHTHRRKTRWSKIRDRAIRQVAVRGRPRAADSTPLQTRVAS